MNLPRLLSNALLLASCLMSLGTLASDRDFRVSSPGDWGRMISDAYRGGGGPGAVADRIRALRQKGGECIDGMLPGGVVDWAAAAAYEKAGQTGRAIELYRAATASPLGDYASFRLGGLLERRGDSAGARTAWGSVSPASELWVPARLNLARGLLSENRPAAAVAVLDDLLDTELDESELTEVRLAMVRALVSAGQNGRAASLARIVWFDRPGASAVAQAEAALAGLGRPITPVDRIIVQVAGASGGKLARACKGARRAAARNSRLDPGLVRAVGGACLLTREENAGRALVELAAASAVAVDPDLRAWIRKLTCDAHIDDDDDQAAAGACLAAVRDYPEGPFAVAAAYDGALAFMRAGSHDGAIALLDRAGESVPASGAANNVRWASALAAMISGRDCEALEALDGILSRTDAGGGVLFGLAERARYFRGVVLHRSGRLAESRADLVRVARSRCCSWYGVMAASRLEQWFGERDQGGVATPPEAEVSAGVSIRHRRKKPETVFVPPLKPGVSSLPGVYLFRLGEVTAAERELSARARRGLLDEEGLAALAALRSGGNGRAALRSAGVLRGNWRLDTAALWTASWPRPFAEFVEKASVQFDVDPALIWAVMRIESNFKPSVRSPAGARGLMQLMGWTAMSMNRLVLQPSGIKADFRSPAGNVMIGTALLDQLATHFDGNLPLVLAGYNAGSGAGRKFLRRLGHLETDLLAEAIPYERTREYIRFVGGHLAAYRYLYGNSSTYRVSFEVPDETGPWLDGRAAGRKKVPVLTRGGPGRAGAGLRRPQ